MSKEKILIQDNKLSSVAGFIWQICLIGLLLTMIIGLFSPPQNNTVLNVKLRQVSQFPFSVSQHLSLAELYYSTGNAMLAQAEIQQAQYLLSFAPSFLQISTDSKLLKNKFASLEKTPQKQQELFGYWQGIAADFPQYRDAWVQLAYLAYNAGDLAKCRFYLNKMQAVDPWFMTKLPPEISSLMR